MTRRDGDDDTQANSSSYCPALTLTQFLMRTITAAIVDMHALGTKIKILFFDYSPLLRIA